VDIESTTILVETSISFADFGERPSRTENSASGKENCETRNKLAAIVITHYFLSYISDKK